MSSYTSSGVFSIVPQKNYLLDDTLETNLLFGRKKIISKLKRAIKTSFIRELNNNNFLGDGGLKLSGGQAQRVSIARAIYGDSQLIIFDEPTTYLDNNLKYKFIKFLKSLNKTIILVSHDKSLFSVANKIVYLK